MPTAPTAPTKPLPPQQVLKQLLRYDRATGGYIWNRRPAVTRLERTWNGRYADQPAGTIANHGRHVLTIEGICYLRARIAWMFHHGDDPGHYEVDHINRDEADDRIENLRLGTHVENSWNRRKRYMGGRRLDDASTGVSLRPNGKWQASIMANGVSHYLGVFASLDEAKRVRNAAVDRLHGEFASRP